MQDRQIYISDTIHNTILLSIYEKEIISTQLFNRLHNISQNSTAYLTFPSNRTKRFEHSLGTMKLCGDMLYFSFINSKPEVITALLHSFKDTINEHIVENRILKSPDAFRPILGDENLEKKTLSNFERLKIENVFYYNYIPQNIKREDIPLYLLVYQSVRICALLHDLGHPPFSHITEYAISNVLKSINEKPNKTKRQEEFSEILKKYNLNGKSTQLHEIMGNKMVERLFSDLLHSNIDWCKDSTFEEKYYKVLLFEIVKLIFEEKTDIASFLHKFVDGVLDGDRLDYVNRDVINSGVNIGKVEYDRLISSMQIFKGENEKIFFLASSAKTINTLEDFFLRRWNLYKNIIYHHRVIKTDSLLKSCLEEIMLNYLSKDSENSSELGENVLPYDISGLWKAIKMANSNTKYFNTLIQWDDNWLSAILKKVYFEDYYRSNCNSDIELKLEELLSNKKNYFSVIKNNSDFMQISKSFEEVFKNCELCDREEFNSIKEIMLRQSAGASILYILEAYFEAYLRKVNFKSFMKETVSSFIKTQENIVSYIVEFKTINTGIDIVEPQVYKDEKIIALSEVSNLKRTLSSEKYLLPYMHIYLNTKKDAKFEKNSFLSVLGQDLAKKLIEYISAI